MVNVIVLNAIMLNVIMLSVVMLSVVTPFNFQIVTLLLFLMFYQKLFSNKLNLFWTSLFIIRASFLYCFVATIIIGASDQGTQTEGESSVRLTSSFCKKYNDVCMTRSS
jgi:hypothetical protein